MTNKIPADGGILQLLLGLSRSLFFYLFSLFLPPSLSLQTDVDAVRLPLSSSGASAAIVIPLSRLSDRAMSACVASAAEVSSEERVCEEHSLFRVFQLHPRQA